MFSWKILLTLIIAATSIIGWQAYSLIKYENEVLVLTNSVDKYKSNELQLNASIETANNTVERILEINSKTGDLLADLSSKTYESNALNAELNARINQLRTTEAAAALERPYERGTAAGVRINDLMKAISGNTTKTIPPVIKPTETIVPGNKLMTQEDIEKFINNSINNQPLPVTGVN